MQFHFPIIQVNKASIIIRLSFLATLECMIITVPLCILKTQDHLQLSTQRIYCNSLELILSPIQY